MVNSKLNTPVGDAGDDFSDAVPEGFSRGPDGQLYPKNKTAISGLRPAARVRNGDGVSECESVEADACALLEEGIIDAGRYVELRIPTERPFEPIKEQMLLPANAPLVPADFSDPKEIAMLMTEARAKLGLVEPPVF